VELRADTDGLDSMACGRMGAGASSTLSWPIDRATQQLFEIASRMLPSCARFGHDQILPAHYNRCRPFWNSAVAANSVH
jgi:hypothetical protein